MMANIWWSLPLTLIVFFAARKLALFRGFLAIIPILIGVLVGYALSFAMGIVDTTPIINAHWFALPT
ncbi:solute carrier family 23 protein, partial [Staphylococcus nepalensis]|nr:solute carrier family 23 protein [Staphylococcus nepalensis]